jgi:hypothetical protein
MAVGEIISAARYNAMQTKVGNVLGVGSGQFGYGQVPLASNQVSSTNTVNANHMQQLKTDAIKAYVHQTGNDPGLPSVATDADITDTVYASYETISNYIFNNKNDIFEATQASVEAKLTNQRTTSWGGNSQPQSVYHRFRVTFTDDNQARYFFNAGGEVRFSASLTGGSGAKYLEWTGMLTAMGTVKFKYNTTTGGSGTSPNGIGYFELTNTDAIIWIKSGSGVYSANDVIIYARKVSAGVVEFTVEFNDGATGSGGGGFSPVDDPVTGTLTSTITQLRPTGIYVSVTSPVYQTTTNLS